MARAIRAIVAIAALGAVATQAANTRPKAPHLVYRVAAGQEVEMELRGYDQDGDALTTTITTLPAAGQLFDLSQVYAQHGRTPKVVPSGAVTGASHPIPSRSKHRIVYRAPSSYTVGAYATLKYIVSDGKQVSAEGVVTLVSDEAAEHVLVASQFSDGTEGWKVLENGKAPSDPVHERSSHKVLNHFVYATDNRLDIAPSGFDRALWYFSAPAKFLGFHAHAYGGSLKFSLGAFSGDFSEAKRDPSLDLVVLECSTCALGKGMRFAYKLSDATFNGAPARFSLLLSEKGKWVKDPKNSLSAWTPPSACEFAEMLDNISAIKILGDFTAWYESVGLDDVQLTSPTVGSRHPLPIGCLCANPGTQCA